MNVEIAHFRLLAKRYSVVHVETMVVDKVIRNFLTGT